MNLNAYTGRLGRDPELSYTGEGLAVANFDIAVENPRDRKKPCAWIKCVCFGKTAEAFCKYNKAGNAVEVEGYAELSRWEDKDGNKRSMLKTIVNRWGFVLSSKKENNQTQSADDSGATGKLADYDSDLPF